MALAVPEVLGTQFTAARAVFQLDGKLFAWGAGVSWSFNYQWSPYKPLNSFEPRSHIPEGYEPTISCNQFKLVDQTMTTFGVQPRLGTSSRQHLINVINRGSFSALIEDDVSGAGIIEGYGLRTSAQNFDIGGGTVMGSASFVCTRLIEVGN